VLRSDLVVEVKSYFTQVTAEHTL